MTIGQRIKAIRVAKNLTQDELGARIGIGKSALSLIETGRNTPSEQTIRSICREFGVREAWLRDGTGDMFSAVPHNLILEAELREFLGEADPFKEALIRILLRLPPEHWETLRDYAVRLVEEGTAAGGDAAAMAETPPTEA